jgi:hypothetical protein
MLVVGCKTEQESLLALRLVAEDNTIEASLASVRVIRECHNKIIQDNGSISVHTIEEVPYLFDVI